MPVRLIIQFLLTVLLVWIMSTFFERFFYVEGGLFSYVIIASLLMLMNVLARPVLSILLLPFRFFFHLLTLIVANALFLWITQRIAANFDPSIVVLHIAQGWGSWLLLAIILGLAHWIIKEIIR